MIRHNTTLDPLAVFLLLSYFGIKELAGFEDSVLSPLTGPTE